MSELALKYCPYCKKNVPYRKASRDGALAFGIIATISASSYLFMLLFMVWRLFGYILTIVSITIYITFEVLYWRWFKKKLRYFCNICKTTVQPKSESFDIPAEPTERKVAYCSNCGAAKEKDQASFFSSCGTKF